MFESLDEIELKKNTRKIYSYLALFMTTCTLIIFINILNYVDAETNYNKVPLILDNAVDVSSVIGMLVSAISFVKKEPSSWQKWTAGILNTMLFVILIGSSIYSIFFK